MPLPPGVGTGYVSVGDYLDANQGTIARERSDLASDIGGQWDAAKTAADQVINTAWENPTSYQDWSTVPGYDAAKQQMQQAAEAGNALGSSGGVADYFQQHYHETRPNAAFDASLYGPENRYTGLTNYLDSTLASVPKAAPSQTPSRHQKPQAPPPGPAPEAPPPLTDPNGGPYYEDPWGQTGGA